MMSVVPSTRPGFEPTTHMVCMRTSKCTGMAVNICDSDLSLIDGQARANDRVVEGSGVARVQVYVYIKYMNILFVESRVGKPEGEAD